MIKKAFFIVIVFALFGGCSNKLNLLAPYKEMVSVYGLLDQSDHIHYIRIERVFQGEGNAYTFAQNPDSVYFKPGDLTVKLERWRNGQQISVDKPFTSRKEIILTDTLMTAATGIFSANELAYKTNPGDSLYADDSTAVYKLVIHNNKTGKDFWAQTGLIGAFQLIAPTTPLNYLQSNYQSSFKMNIVPGNNGSVICVYNSPANSGVCSLDMNLVYTEIETGLQKNTDISLGTLYPSASSPMLGGSREDFTYSGSSLLSDIAVSIPVNTTVTRSLDHIEFVLSAGGVDVALYNQVNSSTSLSQSKANYTNINGGVGVFSSRHKITLIRQVSDIAKDTLAANKQTCKLRFVDHLGVLHACH